jgi:Flp pilus assembly pilin Flp
VKNLCYYKQAGEGMPLFLARKRSGATSIEYALIATLVAVVLAVAIKNLGVIVGVLYDIVQTLVSASM